MAATRSVVTGGGGFIGSHLADALLARGDEVLVIDDFSGGYGRNVPQGARIAPHPVESRDARRAVLDFRPHLVYHAAAYAAEGLSHFIRSHIYTNIVSGSASMVSAAVEAGADHFVLVSSVAVYGHHVPEGTGWFGDETTPHPDDPYGVAKYAAELDLGCAASRFGINYTIFRPHNVIGPRQDLADPFRNVLSIWMNQIMRGEPLTVFGDGTMTRNFTDVRDIVGVIAGAPDIPALAGKAVPIGSPVPVSLGTAAKTVIEEMGEETPGYPARMLPERGEARHAPTRSATLEGLGLPASFRPLRESVRDMVAYAREHGPAEPRRAPYPLEITSGLPAGWAKRFEEVAAC